MKWYSVKEHQPVLTTCCVLLAVRYIDSGSISLWLGEWDDGWKTWDDKENVEDGEWEVLYFCYPDPIPKVYDSLIESENKKQ